MKHLVFIALGGAGGALVRHWLSNAVHQITGHGFPVGTLAVNLLGSIAIGVMYVLIIERGVIHPDWRSVAMIGFLGAFTTFSTFSLETITLIESGQPLHALAYVSMSVGICVAGVWLAMTVTRFV